MNLTTHSTGYGYIDNNFQDTSVSSKIFLPSAINSFCSLGNISYQSDNVSAMTGDGEDIACEYWQNRMGSIQNSSTVISVPNRVSYRVNNTIQAAEIRLPNKIWINSGSTNYYSLCCFTATGRYSAKSCTASSSLRFLPACVIG